MRFVVAPSVAVSPTVGADDAYDLTPGSHVGIVRLPDVDVVIRPKLLVERVLFLLSYTSGRWWTNELANLRCGR